MAQPIRAGPGATTSTRPRRSTASTSPAPQCANHSRPSCQRPDSTMTKPSASKRGAGRIWVTATTLPEGTGAPPDPRPVSGGQVERARKAVEEVAGPAQHLDHPGRDGTIRGELAGDDPVDAQTRAEGEVGRPGPARHVQGGTVHPDVQLGGTEAGRVGGGGQVR